MCIASLICFILHMQQFKSSAELSCPLSLSNMDSSNVPLPSDTYTILDKGLLYIYRQYIHICYNEVWENEKQFRKNQTRIFKINRKWSSHWEVNFFDNWFLVLFYSSEELLDVTWSRAHKACLPVAYVSSPADYYYYYYITFMKKII